MASLGGVGGRVLPLAVVVTLTAAISSVVRAKLLAVGVGEEGLASVSAVGGIGAPTAAIATAPLLRHLPAVRSGTFDTHRLAGEVVLWGTSAFVVMAVISTLTLQGGVLDLPLVLIAAALLAVNLVVAGVATAVLSVAQDPRWSLVQILMAGSQLTVMAGFIGVAATGASVMWATGLGGLPAAIYALIILRKFLSAGKVTDQDDTRARVVGFANTGLVILASSSDFGVRYLVGFNDLGDAAKLQVGLTVSGMIASGISWVVQAGVMPVALQHGGTAQHTLRRLAVSVGIVGVLLLLVLGLLGGDLISLLYNDDLRAAKEIVVLLTSAELIYGVTSFFTTIAFARGIYRLWTYGSGTYFLVKFCAAVFLSVFSMLSVSAVGFAYLLAATASLLVCLAFRRPLATTKEYVE